MTRALAVTLIALSVALTALTIWSNLTVRTTTGPAHFWAEFSRFGAFGSWLFLAMMWCTHRVVEAIRSLPKEVGKKVGTKVDKLESHLDESIAEVGENLGVVKRVVGEINKDRLEANAVVLNLFRDKDKRAR